MILSWNWFERRLKFLIQGVSLVMPYIFYGTWLRVNFFPYKLR